MNREALVAFAEALERGSYPQAKYTVGSAWGVCGSEGKRCAQGVAFALAGEDEFRTTRRRLDPVAATDEAVAKLFGISEVDAKRIRLANDNAADGGEHAAAAKVVRAILARQEEA